MNFSPIILFIRDNARYSLSLRMDNQLLRPYRIESLRPEFPGYHGIAQQYALLLHLERILMPGTF